MTKCSTDSVAMKAIDDVFDIVHGCFFARIFAAIWLRVVAPRSALIQINTSANWQEASLLFHGICCTIATKEANKIMSQLKQIKQAHNTLLRLLLL